MDFRSHNISYPLVREEMIFMKNIINLSVSPPTYSVYVESENEEEPAERFGRLKKKL